MIKAQVLSKIRQYILAAYAWHESVENFNPHKEYGLKLWVLEEEILFSFGLPVRALCYSEILQAEGFQIDNLRQRALKTYYKLLAAARLWFLSPIVSDLELLSSAKLGFTHVQNVLPLMGFGCSRYAAYLYYDLFLTGFIDEQELLYCLRSENDLETVCNVIIPGIYNEMSNERIYRLEALDLPYLQAYLHYLVETDCLQDWDIPPQGLNPGIPEFKGTVTDLDDFVLHNVCILEPDTCFLEGIYWTGTAYRFLCIACTQSQILAVLSYALYPCQAGCLKYRVQQYKPEDIAFEYNLLDEDQHNLLINRCALRLGRAFDNQPKSADELANYTLLCILPNDSPEVNVDVRTYPPKFEEE